MSYFPENKISHFITRLAIPIELKGEWEVGMVEFIYPHTWYNINNRNNLFGFALGNGKTVARRIPLGCYENVQDILDAMYLEEHKDRIISKYNKVTKLVEFEVKDAKLILEEGLAQVLGFEPMEIQSMDVNVSGNRKSVFVVDPSVHYHMLLVYADIVEPQIVGDVLAPLLRVVRVKGHDGEMVREHYDRPHYLPVNRKFIETLEIVIRTHAGHLTPFERGRSYVKLHFRQKALS